MLEGSLSSRRFLQFRVSARVNWVLRQLKATIRTLSSNELAMLWRTDKRSTLAFIWSLSLKRATLSIDWPAPPLKTSTRTSSVVSAKVRTKSLPPIHIGIFLIWLTVVPVWFIRDREHTARVRQPWVWPALLHLLSKHETVRQESAGGAERVRSVQTSEWWVQATICPDPQDAQHIQD